MKIDELPRKAVTSYLELTRLPLTQVERVLGKQGTAWAPAIAVDRLQAKIKGAAGSLLNDETLLADARLQQGALDELTRAATLEAEAAALREQANEQLRAEQAAAAADAAEVRERAEARERAVEQQEAAERAKVAQKTAAKKSSARKIAAAQEEAIDLREAKARKEALVAESAAVREERAAIEAKAEALAIEDRLQATKAARKRS